MRAFVCDVSVTMPACEPVREMARCPRSLIAIAHSAHDWRSPVDSSMSISRGSGCGEISCASRISRSVSLPRAESTATTRRPACFFATILPAARLIFSASATEVPPNFMTTVPFMRTRQISCALLLVALALAGCGGASNRRAVAGTPELALGMPVGDAVAQLFAVGFAGTGPQAPMVKRLRDRPWGVVVLDAENALAPVQSRALAQALVTAAHRGGRPAPLIATSEPGRYPGVSMLPQYQQVSASDARNQAHAAGQVLRAGGVRAVFAPVADLAYASGPAADMGFTDDASRAARLTGAAAEGWVGAGVQPIVGHFPGQGAASGDPEETPATVGLSIEDLRRRDLIPFATAAKDEAPAIEVSNALYTAFDGVTPATLLPDAYRLLRRTGFAGTAVSGDLVAATAATGASVGRAAVDALRAGADLLVIPGDAANQDEAYRAVLAAVQRGRISRARVADALLHVSALKRAAQQPVS